MTSAVTVQRGVLRLETCAGSWLVDAAHRRYCRVERGTPAAFVPPAAWRPFHALMVGDGGIVRLVLDAHGASAVSGWLHDTGCARCRAYALRSAA